MKPRLLDLFCGAGGCSVGYHRAGFDVTGVDMGIDWMGWRDLCESIPPAYTEWIGTRLLAAIEERAA